MSERFTCPPEHKHDETQTCYSNHGCRCDDCRALNRDYMFWRAGMIRAGRPPVKSIDATGTRRRIEALMALGWGAGELARRLGTTVQAVNVYRTEERVVPATAQRVAALYDELWNRRPEPTTMPERISHTRTLKFARERGFAPPMAWDDIDHDDAPQQGVEVDVDEVRVALAVDGGRVELTPREREEAVRVLNGRGRNDREIADVLGIASKSVLRIRQRIGLPERFNQINGRPGYRGEDAA